MRKLVFLVFLTLVFHSSAEIYRIELNWDQFTAECNGILSGTIDNEPGFVQGIHAQKTLNGRLSSLGEGGFGFDAGQTFEINAESGYFSFWIRDKFSDDDLKPDMTRLADAKPVIKIYRENNLIEQIKVPKGEGLVCKVFNLDMDSGIIDKELRYYPKSRMIIGMVVDCITGAPLPDALLSITDDLGKSAILSTDAEGIFSYPCEIGVYELVLSKTGYIGIQAQVEMGIDESPREIVFAMSEEVLNYRIVLTWGSRPKDLDAHLSGPNPDGGNFHIWYQDHYLIGGKDFLDRDDRNSYGPETITIYNPAVGTYKYSVFDYSNRGRKNSKSLKRSSARVDIYGDNRLIKSFSVPSGNGNCWHVFEIDQNHNIIPINNITYARDDKYIHTY
jgi:hypothetical protein